MEGEACPACGWQTRRRPEAAIVIDGDLALMDRLKGQEHHEPSPEDKRAFYAQLLHIANMRGYKRGWAAHKFREKCGHWPGFGDVKPEEPEAAVWSWVRSRMIAYAKAKAKAEASI